MLAQATMMVTLPQLPARQNILFVFLVCMCLQTRLERILLERTRLERIIELG